MQGTRVQALVGEDPTCCRATGPVRHNYWACALEPASHNYWARVPQLLKKTKTKTFILVSLCTRARILCFQNLVFSRSAHPTLPHLLWRHHHQVPAGPAPASELWHSSCPDSSSMTLKLFCSISVGLSPLPKPLLYIQSAPHRLVYDSTSCASASLSK